MNTIKVSLDKSAYRDKPNGSEINTISNRIGHSVKIFNVTTENTEKLVLSVGRDGHTFCPATFENGKRSKDNFEQQQVFTLDFDNKNPDRTVSHQDVQNRAMKYNLPIWFTYDTFSSTNHNKFRIVFLNDTSITDRKVAEAMQLAMGMIFPEADPSCYKDVSKMYFGGKEILYHDTTVPTTNVESVFRGLTYYLQDTKGNHYKEQLSKFSCNTGIALNKNGFLNVTVESSPTKTAGAIPSSENRKNSPNSIIYTPNIIANGEIFQNRYYHIELNDCTNKPYVSTEDHRDDVLHKQYKNHNPYRRSDIDRMSQMCRLFREFESGSRDMSHDELFGILNNLINVDSGITKFIEIQRKYPELYDNNRITEWKRHISYNRQQEYKPSSCDGFCPYRDECDHGKNILSTIRLRSGAMERILGYKEELFSLEDAQNDTYKAIKKAFLAKDNQVHIIKAQVGVGKSYSYLKLMEENPEVRFLIAAPTNLLKDELFKRAKKKGVDTRKTPSLEQIKAEIPHKVWRHIQKFYKRGQAYLVHKYISELLNKKHISCLEKYMKAREELRNHHGSLITTHRYLLTMDEKRLKEFDAIIIDEDILFKSVITNQEEIPLSVLKKWATKTTDLSLSKKMKRLLKLTKDQRCIELDSFEWDDKTENDKLPPFDVPSFCRSERFYLRRALEEPRLKEDTVVYLKPASFKEDVKYIIVSATTDETIYRQYFGEDRVQFYECKSARYIGTLHQYPGKSMSRRSIANNDGIVQRLMKRFNMDERHVITFMRENIGSLHFGNTEGSNALEGEDILVVGTPYHADFIYKLAAFTMGLDFDEDEGVELQAVRHNGYRFRFTTFKDENLQAIQFWMIESELEQAVGRARLLRNPCNVHLFSNFPLRQSEMVDGFDYTCA